MRFKIVTAARFLLAAQLCSGARLTPGAEQAFDGYTRKVEALISQRHARPETYLAFLTLPPSKRADAEHQLMSGGVRIEPVNGGTWQVTGALLHHWRAAAFVPGATPAQLADLLRDCDHFPAYYSPQVQACHLLPSEGSGATVAIRFKERQVVTVVLDAVYTVEAGLVGGSRGYNFARSKHIWQIDEAGTPHECRRREGDDDGFLWRLNSYWSFLQFSNGLLVECDAVSLTRGVPTGLGWLLAPIVKDLPREFLAFTVEATRNALIARPAKKVHL